MIDLSSIDRALERHACHDAEWLFSACVGPAIQNPLKSHVIPGATSEASEPGIHDSLPASFLS